jgi:hypothetical protein
MRCVRVTVVVMLACLAWLPQSAAAAILTFEPATITSSTPFDVDIQIQNVDFLYGFFFNLLYDPKVVDVAGVQEGGFLGPTMPPADPATAFGFTNDSVNGVLFIFNTRLAEPFGISGNGSLALVTFRPLVPTGNAIIGFSELDFSAILPPEPCEDEEGDCPTSDFPVRIAVNGSPGQILIQQTTPVPEPATIALVGLGLIGVRRRMR